MDKLPATPSPDDPFPKEKLEDQLYRQELEIRMQQLTRDQLHTEESLKNLALLHLHRMQAKAVMPLEERALTIYEYRYGRGHPAVATHLHDLAEFYKQNGKLELAEPLYEQALTIRTERLGPLHPDTITSYSELIWTHERQGKSQRADECSRRFGQLQVQAQAERNGNETSSTSSLSQKADKPKQEADKKKERPQKTRTPHAQAPQRSPLELAEFYEQQGEYAQAEDQFLRALTAKLAQKDADPPGLAHFYLRLADFYKRQSPQTQDAQMYSQLAEQIFKQHGISGIPDTRLKEASSSANRTKAQSERKARLMLLIFVGIALFAGILALGILLFR